MDFASKGRALVPWALKENIKMLKRIKKSNIVEGSGESESLAPSSSLSLIASFLNSQSSILREEDYILYSYTGENLFKALKCKRFFRDLNEDTLLHCKTTATQGVYIFENLNASAKGKGESESLGPSKTLVLEEPCTQSRKRFYIGSSVSIVSRVKRHAFYCRTKLQHDLELSGSRFNLYVISFVRYTMLIRRVELEVVRGLLSWGGLLKDEEDIDSLVYMDELRGLYNERLPSPQLLQDASRDLGVRSLSIYSCEFCELSGNYLKHNKFESVGSASKHYSVSQKLIKESLFQGLFPTKGNLSGFGVKVILNNKEKTLYFFEFETSRFGIPLVCYDKWGSFLGYFNSGKSAGSFFGLNSYMISENSNSNLEDDYVWCASKDLYLRFYQMNLKVLDSLIVRKQIVGSASKGQRERPCS